MSIDITSINVGTGPNTGTGIPVRDAFEIVNSNFANIGTFFTNGNIAKINVSSTITGQSIVSNTSITSQTLLITANAVVTGNLQAGSITTAGKVTAAAADITGNVTAAGFVGAVYGNVTGNAATATKLATASTINGVAFDGTANIVLPASASASLLTGSTLSPNVTVSSLTAVGTLVNLTVTNPINGDVTGNAYSSTVSGSATVAGTVIDAAQPNIKSVGTLTSLAVTGGVTAASFTGPVTGDVTGNAATATKLATARTINGVAFDGTANITVTAAAGTLTGTTLAAGVTASSLTSVGTLGSLTVTGAVSAATVNGITGLSAALPEALGVAAIGLATTAARADHVHELPTSVSGNASTATKLATARTINGVAFDGTASITVTAAAGTLTGTTLTNTVTASSLTSVGTLGNLTVSGNISAGFVTGTLTGSIGSLVPDTGLFTRVDTSGDVTIGGNLSVNGTTTTVNATTLDVADLNITVAKNATTAASANGAGITVAGANATIIYSSSTDSWDLNKNLSATLRTAAQPNITSVGTLGNLTVSGTITGALAGNASSAAKLATARTINGVAFDGTANITVTAAADTLTGAILATGVTESSLTSVGTLTSLAVTGGVTAASFTGPVTGNASTATTLATARTINGVSFNGSTNITVTAAAGTLTGATLAAGVTTSSLTTVGTLTSLTVTNGVTATSFTGALTGNASSATKLATARTINGVAFDGTANITITASAGSMSGTTLDPSVTSSSLTSVGTLGNLTVSGAVIGDTFQSTSNGLGTNFRVGDEAWLGDVNIANTISVQGIVDPTVGYFKFGTAGTVIGFDGTKFVINGATTISGAATATSFTGAGTGLTGTASNLTVKAATFQSSDVVGTSCLLVFQNTPAGAISSKECNAWADAPNTGRWVIQSIRHTNSTNLWGTQIAYGWEDNANAIYQRNVTSGVWSSWTRVDVSSANITELVNDAGFITGAASITGNAATATILQTARTINGVSFNGSANITINAVDATARIASTEKGTANGVATLGVDGKVPSTQLPSYVDDVLEYANLAGFPVSGETAKIYVALDTNKTYRWSGSAYVYITSGAVDSVAGKTGVVTLVKADVGLGSVDNTSDAAKPVSTAQQSALDLKANLASPTFTGVPLSTTAAVGTNTTQVATTAFVQAEIAADAPTKTGGGASGTWAISISGTATTATKLSNTAANWVESGVIGNVVGSLAWKNFNNGHVIFDASAGTSPSGAAIGNMDPAAPWAATYPTLMGWNGIQTYGVRVDSARVADSAASATTATTATTANGLNSANSYTVAGLTVPSITKSGTTGVGNIGQSTNTFGTVYATTFSGVSTTAKYADLAEMYEGDQNYVSGTVLVFGGAKEVTTTAMFADTRVAGAVSTNPAYLMNSELNGVAIALRGRVPLRVIGPVAKGDLLVTAPVEGCAVSVGNDRTYGAAIFAKALTTNDTEFECIIEAVIL